MTTIDVSERVLSVRFSPWQKLAGLVRDLDVPLDAVTGVTVEEHGVAAVRGVRAPGLGLPGVLLLGTWRGRGTKRLVAVRRGQQALRVTLRGQRYDELLLGTDDAAALADRLAARTA